MSEEDGRVNEMDIDLTTIMNNFDCDDQARDEEMQEQIRIDHEQELGNILNRAHELSHANQEPVEAIETHEDEMIKYKTMIKIKRYYQHATFSQFLIIKSDDELLNMSIDKIVGELNIIKLRVSSSTSQVMAGALFDKICQSLESTGKSFGYNIDGFCDDMKEPHVRLVLDEILLDSDILDINPKYKLIGYMGLSAINRFNMNNLENPVVDEEINDKLNEPIDDTIINEYSDL